MNDIEQIIALEWQAFDKVHNEGGRASCQDDFASFELMRKSQFLAWNEACLTAYLGDLLNAAALGRNLVQEKYARMMASTAPAQYAAFAHQLPRLSSWQLASIEAIVATQLAWREAFARDYPLLSGQARLIYSHQDTPQQTSFETYLRGELATYSAPTLLAYKTMVEDLALVGGNLTLESMRHTARLYGYRDLAAAEESLGRGQALPGD